MLSLLFLAGLLLAQAPATEEPRKPVLEGVVLQEGSGQPVAKATVTVVRIGSGDQNPPKVEAREDGTFKFEELSPGTYLVLAEKTGFARRAYGAKNDGALRGLPVRLQMKETRKVEIRLFKQGVLKGKVTDADGEPVQGVVMVALRATYQRGRKMYAPAGQVPVQTNDAGEYRLPALPAGKFTVCAMPMSVISGAGMTPPPPKVGPSGKPESSVLTCYPNVTDRASATPVEVGDGMEVPGIDIRLERRIVVHVKGQIMNLPANVPPAIVLSLAPKGAGITGMMFSNRAISTGGDGKFEFANVTPGSYVLHTLPTGLGATTFGVKSAVELGDENVDNLQVAALAPSDLPGRIVIDGRDEVKGFEKTRLTLTAFDDVYQSIPTAPIKVDGTFTVGGVTADRYVVNLSGLPENCYLKSAKFGEKSWNDGTVEIGATTQPFTLVVGDDAATMTGIVQDEKGEAAPGTFAVLVDKTRRAGRNKTARADERGMFRVTGVDPGEYLVFAADEIDSGAVDDEDYVKPWLSKAQSVTAAAGGQASVNVKVQR